MANVGIWKASNHQCVMVLKIIRRVFKVFVLFFSERPQSLGDKGTIHNYNIQVIQVVHTIEIISLVYFRDHTYILKTGSNNSTNNGTHYSSEQDTRFLKEN